MAGNRALHYGHPQTAVLQLAPTDAQHRKAVLQ